MAFGKWKVKEKFWSSVYSVSLHGHPLQKALRSSCLGPGWFSSVISILIWLQRTILNSITESSSNRFNQIAQVLCWNVPPPLQPKHFLSRNALWRLNWMETSVERPHATIGLKPGLSTIRNNFANFHPYLLHCFLTDNIVLHCLCFLSGPHQQLDNSLVTASS